jgi:protein phosphatase
MIIDFAARVDIGTKETNDDRILINGKVLDTGTVSGTIEIPSIAVVCDGCGGYFGGNIAAQTVLEYLSNEEPSKLSDPIYLASVLDNCQLAVMKKKREFPRFPEMCTTIAGCVFCSDKILFFHSGDSRVYRLDQWGIAKMTRDHSLVQDMIDMGEITPEEALTHPRRNVITRCIGIKGRPPEIYVAHTSVHSGEKYLLCSDGLWESVSNSQIVELLSSNIPLRQMADDLVQMALMQGSDDNISACICSGQ